MKNKRYENLNQILDDIDRFKAKAAVLAKRASALDSEADRLLKMDDHKLSELIGFKRLTARKMRKSAFNIEEKKLHSLKEKLAEFQTGILPGILTTDRSIKA